MRGKNGSQKDGQLARVMDGHEWGLPALDLATLSFCMSLHLPRFGLTLQIQVRLQHNSVEKRHKLDVA